MAKRHNREYFYMAATGTMRGPDPERPATPSERQRGFRFSEIVVGKDARHSDALLRAVAEVMTGTGPGVDGDIPAGFTYLGQFVDHDLTKDETNVGFNTPVTDIAQMRSGRSPALDLDSVYGRGPEQDQVFYEHDGLRLKTGKTLKAPPAVAQQELDGFDLPRLGLLTAEPEDVRLAEIPDRRNDENLAVAQTHLAFIRFHNQVANLLSAGGTPSKVIFDRTREKVVKHYQWMLRTDYLPRIVDPAIVEDVFANGRRVFEVDVLHEATMPLEFSVGAFRIGHSMIRERYEWNAVFNGGPGALADGSLMNLFQFSGTSGTLTPGADLDNPRPGQNEHLPTNWVADWTQIYDFAADGHHELAPELPFNFARALDIHLVDPLKALPLGSFGARGAPPADPLERNLAFRNLVRGRMVGLSSGQSVADHLMAVGVPGIRKLSAAEILGAEFDGAPAAIKDELAAQTPLWFYVLREAELNGGRLGGVGGRIVAETIHRAMEVSDHSIVRDPFFRPDLGVGERFHMTDLLLVAYDAAKGELRPLSPNAPRPPAAVA